MATMIPDKPYNTKSEGEIRVFEALQDGLTDDYYVFHSLRWKGKRKIHGEADFVIFNRHKGVMIIEVKSGIIEHRNRTFYQRRRDTGKERRIKDPERQAYDSNFEIYNLLIDNNINDCMVCHAVWFPSVEFEYNNNLPPEYSVKTLFDISDLEDPLWAINEAYDYSSICDYRRVTNLSEKRADRILNIIAPNLSIVPAMQVEYRSRERKFYRLTNEQIRILDFLEEQKFATIKGRAGTGKTFIAFEKARRLAEKGEEVLLLCTNKSLAKYLMSINTCKNLIIKTFRSLAKKYLLNDISDEELQELFVSYLNNFEYGCLFSNMIIDEGQDFKDEWLRALKYSTRGFFYIFYDEHQNLFGKHLPSLLAQADCRLTLTKNCRNTKEIAITASRNLNLQNYHLTAAVKGMKALWIECSSLQSKINYIHKVIDKHEQEKNGKKEDIAILTVRKLKESCLYGSDCLQKYPISSFPYKKHISFNTVRKFKGLEANVVILIDVDIHAYEKAHWKNLMYLACSRAKHELYILVDAFIEESYELALNYLQPVNISYSKKRSIFLKHFHLELVKI